ncbi:hypothetical protein KCU78_g4042, partial [Aureobasidium melanogenum]
MANTTSMPTEPAMLPGFDPAPDDMSSEFWASVRAFTNHPQDVKQKSIRFQSLIAVFGRMADNMAKEHGSTEGALTHEFSKALLDVSEMPLFHKPTKRKNQETTSNHSKKARTALDNTPKEVLTDKTNGAMTARPTPFSLSPSKEGDQWTTIWATIISQVPATNPSTGKAYTWPANLTNMLEFVWGPGGVDNTLNMAQTVVDNFGLYSTDADYVQAELVLEYKRLAETFRTLEYETRGRTTSLGRLWDAREDNSKLEVTDQARANFVMNHVVCSMNPEEMTAEKRKEEIKKFRREREFAFNITMFVRLFGWGVVPLLARAPWRQVLGNVPSSTLNVYLSQLQAAVPTLRQICDRIDANFFQHMRKPGAVKKISKTCFQGLEVKKKNHRAKHTMAWLFATSGQLEEPGSVFQGSDMEVDIEKGKSVLGGHTHQTGDKEVEEDTFDDFDYRKYIE